MSRALKQRHAIHTKPAIAVTIALLVVVNLLNNRWAPAWILLEDDGGAVTVTVRDDGPGIPDGRLAEAAAAGRLGVARSIHGRLTDLGGTATLTSTPGQGTEVELRVYRDPRD